jgi:hypothetical protein
MKLWQRFSRRYRYLAKSRDKKIKSFIDTKRPGLEIGPSHAPICPKSAGFDVEIIDHMSQADLRTKYAEHGVNLAAIEPVDYVWKGQSYRELTGKTYGWIIASHVIEHTPDLIAFFNSCDEILEPDGILSLAIPDKRYCFDHMRPQSSLASVIDAHEQKRTVHSPGTVADYFMNVCALKRGGWDRANPETLEYVHTVEQAISGLNAARAGHFLDVHAWCFTPSNFRLIVEDLHRLGYIQLRECGFYDTAGNEFFVTLSRRGSGPSVSRMGLARSQ